MNKSIKCKGCGIEVNSSSKLCPMCGAAVIKPIYKTAWFWGLLALIILILGLTITIVSLFTLKVADSNQKAMEQYEEQVKVINKYNKSAEVSRKEPPIEDKSNNTPPEENEKYEILGDTTSSRDTMSNIYIRGTLKNNYIKDIEYLKVKFKLYDSDGNEIGEASASGFNIGSGGTWEFSAMGKDKDGVVETYKLDDIYVP